MPRPEMSGTVIDNGADEVGGTNGTQDESGSEVDNSFDEQGGDTDVNRGAEDSEIAADVGPEEGQDGGTEPGAESGQDATTKTHLDKIRDDLRNELKEELMAEMKAHQPPPPAEKPKEISEQEWVEHESKWGIPRTAIQNVTQRMVSVVNHVMSEMDKRFAKFEKSDAVRALSQDKEFSDAGRYQKDIDEFLTHYDVKYHSNPDLLKRAVIFARGKNMKANVQKAAQGSERNRRIAGIARPAGAGPSGKSAAPSRQLTATERSAARIAGWSDAEYLKNKGAKKVLS